MRCIYAHERGEKLDKAFTARSRSAEDETQAGGRESNRLRYYRSWRQRRERAGVST
jgi:hypothetical protein